MAWEALNNIAAAKDSRLVEKMAAGSSLKDYLSINFCPMYFSTLTMDPRHKLCRERT